MNKMKKTGVAFAALLLTMTATAGGILTNTNQNLAFNRMMSREASIGIDGVYSNPAGCAFMNEGLHLSVNWQMPWQTRTVESQYPLFANRKGATSDRQTFDGHAFCPVIPSIQGVWNKGKWSLQANFSIGGAGGKCSFDDGLGSLERMVANTAMGVSQIAGGIDQVMQAAGMPASGLGQRFAHGQYSYDAAMDGQQFYWGLSLGAAYKVTPHLSVFAGIRGVYAACTYTGHVSGITVDGTPLYTLLDAQNKGAADLSLDCDQTGTGFTPLLGIDYKAGRWNFSARYEFKTRIRLKNDATNRVPDVTAMVPGLVAAGIPAQVLGSEPLAGKLGGFAQQFQAAAAHTLGEFADGQSIAADIPALFTIGAGCEVIDGLRINVGYHYFDDKHATQYAHRERKLKHGTIEYNAGVEWDATKLLTVSTGWQNTNYGMTDEYMEDTSFSVDSNSFGVGVCLHLSPKIEANVSYFRTFYKHYDQNGTDATTGLDYHNRYTRNNDVVGIGVDFHF